MSPLVKTESLIWQWQGPTAQLQVRIPRPEVRIFDLIKLLGGLLDPGQVRLEPKQFEPLKGVNEHTLGLLDPSVRGRDLTSSVRTFPDPRLLREATSSRGYTCRIPSKGTKPDCLGERRNLWVRTQVHRLSRPTISR